MAEAEKTIKEKEMSMVEEEEKTVHERKSTEDRFSEEEMGWKLKELEEGGEYIVGGETIIDYEVIGAVAATAAREVRGVTSVGSSSITRMLAETFGASNKRARGTKVEAGKKEAIVSLDVRIEYGFSIPQLVIDIRKKVGARLLDMFGLIAKEINVNVAGIDFPERAAPKVL